MVWRPPRYTLTDTLYPDTTLVRSIPCLGLNGGPAFRHSEAFSFQVATDDQAETDRLWNAIVDNVGEESACGWCRDKRSEEHTSELQSLMRTSYAAFCLITKNNTTIRTSTYSY